ncbi:uncharacterized protein B0H18DRAFT_1181536 [Fomitopsis serialis]|uniref:uncharacterized protein n=1 Tax=Fomitopsis serialis TaxID=139415 RepID=UPI0020088E81|nr:uncharacterized protein B0H18DRAFT_1181536 [Neoantrodia serialis]KAH9934834.1 hypothetical protein B0H18DRAFT_1181536 [Neoantrodia serialis]
MGRYVIFDGLKAAKSLVDARTDLDNPRDERAAHLPATFRDKFAMMEQDIMILACRREAREHDAPKTKKQFQRMNTILKLEAVLFEATKQKDGSCPRAPMGVLVMDKFGMTTFISTHSDLTGNRSDNDISILIPYHRSLLMHEELTSICEAMKHLRGSRRALAEWAAQPYLEDHSWEQNGRICAQ